MYRRKKYLFYAKPLKVDFFPLLKTQNFLIPKAIACMFCQAAQAKLRAVKQVSHQ